MKEIRENRPYERHKDKTIDNSTDSSKDRYDSTDMSKAIEVLQSGGIILYPTDTVWGIGCDATNEDAVKKIYELKHRIDSKSMLVLVGSEGALQQYVEEVPETAWMLIETAVNPLTIIYDRPKGLAKNLLSEDGSAGIRITNELFSRTLCQRLRKPIVSTSANIAGEKTPRNFTEITPEIIEGVDYVVKFRREDTNKSKPSNIIKVSDSGIIKIIR
ncbi:MAG: threonylcarbamoyl-AMP synthase [Bacteroides sp.]|nr:threonylcarbamoyl-AMP synthase [Bacteroides sp.]